MARKSEHHTELISLKAQQNGHLIVIHIIEWFCAMGTRPMTMGKRIDEIKMPYSGNGVNACIDKFY